LDILRELPNVPQYPIVLSPLDQECLFNESMEVAKKLTIKNAHKSYSLAAICNAM
jgi:hypothetical protein